jgi:hypothetical protein
MTFTRFLCWIVCKTLHSASKVLKALNNCKFRTLIATLVPSKSTPLYTEPKPSYPSKLLSQKLFVPWQSSRYDIILCSNTGNVLNKLETCKLLSQCLLGI